MTNQLETCEPLASADAQDLLSPAGTADPWAVVRHGPDLALRGRLDPGTARLPARPARPGARGTTFGLSSHPAVLHTVSAAFRVPANTPWVVLSRTEWRITASSPAALHLVHLQGLAADLVDDVVADQRPTLFEGPSAKVVRTAIRAAAPARIGATSSSHDTASLDAFAMMVTWVLDRQARSEDPRLGPVLHHITANLSDPTMTTTALATRIRVSRRTLQNLFAPYGGLASYIRQQRVDTAITLLTAQAGTAPDLDDVAQVTGLGSRRTLERAVRQVYGLTPRQAREHVLAGFRLRRRGGRREPAVT
ncbi:MAG: helix-turn-helix domain-containing protein [Marmoricola sp.]